MKTIAIITARGGSKRIPKKNIKEFCGKPIISYSIEAAVNSEMFDEVMVSTDSAQIAKIAKSYGANVPFLRNEETSNDYATTADVLNEVLDEYLKIGQSFDTLCCIYPTAPFVTSEKLKTAVKMLEQANADSLIPVVQFSFPPQRGVIIVDNKVVYAEPKFANSRSQDLQPIYHDCGQFYLCKINAFKKYKTLVTPNTVPFIMPDQEVQDIDNPSDWALAEEKYKTFILREDAK